MNLNRISELILVLQIFVEIFLSYMLASRGRAFIKIVYRKYLWKVGHGFSVAGSYGYRHNNLINMNFHISRKLASYANDNPATIRMQPIVIPYHIYHILL